MPRGGNNLSLIRNSALIALLALAGAGGEITPMIGATNHDVEVEEEKATEILQRLYSKK